MSEPELGLLVAPLELELSSITIDGAAFPLGAVLADVTIRHGRAGFFDSSSPSTAQLTLLGVTRAMMRPFRLGSLLVVNATDGSTVAPRFTGRLTDAALDVDVLTAIAVGRLRTLSGYTVGTVAYPEETWSSRVTRAFTEAGLATPNRIANGSYETDTAGSVAWGASAIARSTLEARVGVASCAVTVSGSAGSQGMETVATLTVAGAHRFDGWVKVPAGIIVMAMVYEPTLTTELARVHVTGTGEWQPFAAPFTAAGAGVYPCFVITYGPTPCTFYVDGLEAHDAGNVLELAVGTFDPIMVARPAEPVLLSTMLESLAAQVQAAVSDRPDGRIFVQALGARTVGSVTPLDPAEVAYAPVWEQRLPGANVLTVTYGEPEASVSSSDAASVALYGPIPVTIATELKNAADANQVLQNRLGRDAFSHWTIPSAPLLVGRRLSVGQAVRLSLLPSSAPYDPWSTILEGWTDRVTADADGLAWTMELALSDPLLSGITLQWSGVPNDAAHRWNTINQAVAWRDALTLDSLTP